MWLILECYYRQLYIPDLVGETYYIIKPCLLAFGLLKNIAVKEMISLFRLVEMPELTLRLSSLDLHVQHVSLIVQ